MIRNHLKIAIRQILKQKFYALINVAGLALSVACCLLIYLYIQHELSYDQHHKNADQLYRLALDINLNQSVGKGVALPPPAGKTLVDDFPEIVNSARLNPFFFNAGTNLVRLEEQEQSVFQENFVYIDHSFTEMFNFPKIGGDRNTWLLEPFTVIITQKIADRFFPDADPVGRYLILNDDKVNQRYQVTGVVEDIPDNSHFHFDYFMSMTTLEDSEANNWVFNNYHTYVQLAEGTDFEALNRKLPEWGLQYLGPQFREQMKIDLAEVRKMGSRYDFFLQPLADIHLNSKDFKPTLEANGDIRYISLFLVIGLFLLLIAIVNFVNLSTARSTNRGKEVGVRKVLGSFKKQLVGQFLTESILVCLIGFGIGLVIAHLAQPYFMELSGKNLRIPYENPAFLPTLLLMAVLIGVVAGAYPAFYLSGFNPISVLKGKLNFGSNSGWLRKSLVVVQFAISAGLIIGSLIVFQQMQFIQNKKIGFEKDQVLLIHDTYTLDDQAYTYKDELKTLPGVESASVSSYLPLDGGFRNTIMFYEENKTDAADQIPIQTWSVDHDYIPTLEMNILAGRNFEKDRISDSTAVILNETAVQQMGIEDPLGKRIKSPFIGGEYTIIGVVEDFNFESLRDEMKGLGLFFGRNNSTVSVKVSSKNIDRMIFEAERLWKKFAPHQAFRYSFLDERFDQMYDGERRSANLFSIFTLVAIFIACLGLFALATFTAEQRTKEIGIRKVLGAPVLGLVNLLSKDYLKLVGVGLLIASPLAYYFMNQWLQGFEYRISIAWWTFLIAGAGAIFIAFLTVSYQSIKAALMNPIDSLRNE